MAMAASSVVVVMTVAVTVRLLWAISDRPISDIRVVITEQGETVPEGYYLLERTVSGEFEANTNFKSSGPKIQLAYKRQEAGELAITDLCLVVKAKSTAEDCPAGFTLIEKTEGGKPADLNLGSSGNRVYLAYRKQRFHRPITAIGMVILSSEEVMPIEHFEVKGLLAKSCTGRFSGDLNGEGGKGYLHLCGRKGVIKAVNEIGWDRKKGFVVCRHIIVMPPHACRVMILTDSCCALNALARTNASRVALAGLASRSVNRRATGS
jgi:hypothetical protein